MFPKSSSNFQLIFMIKGREPLNEQKPNIRASMRLNLYFSLFWIFILFAFWSFDLKLEIRLNSRFILDTLFYFVWNNKSVASERFKNCSFENSVPICLEVKDISLFDQGIPLNENKKRRLESAWVQKNK